MLYRSIKDAAGPVARDRHNHAHGFLPAPCFLLPFAQNHGGILPKRFASLRALCRAFLKRQFVFRSELGLGLYGEFGGSRGWWVGVGVGTGVVEPRA